MSQLIEFVMTLVGNKRFVDLMRQAVPRLIYITLGVSARHAPDTKHFLSEQKAWSVARLNYGDEDVSTLHNRLAHSGVPV